MRWLSRASNLLFAARFRFGLWFRSFFCSCHLAHLLLANIKNDFPTITSRKFGARTAMIFHICGHSHARIACEAPAAHAVAQVRLLYRLFPTGHRAREALRSQIIQEMLHRRSGRPRRRAYASLSRSPEDIDSGRPENTFLGGIRLWERKRNSRELNWHLL